MTINKRVAVSFVTIAATLAAVVGITLAQFTDTATLSNNSLDTGNADLQIGEFDGSNCVSFSGTSTGIDTNNAAPGQEFTKAFCLRNDSDSAISLDVNGTVNIDGGNTLDPSLVTITITCAGNAPVEGTLDAFPSTVIVDNLAQNSEVGCNIKQKLSETATNGAQNQQVQYDVIFNAVQS